MATRKPYARAPKGTRTAGAPAASAVVKGPATRKGKAVPRVARRTAAALRERTGAAEVLALKAQYEVSDETLALMLGISRATLARIKKGSRLSPHVLDRLARYSRLMAYAAIVNGTEEYGRMWLKMPQRGLGGQIPIELATTERGANEVHDMLGRIEYGVYW